MTAAERKKPSPIIEATTLQEGLYKLGSMATTARNLQIAASPELALMLKLAHRAHPNLQAILVDLSCYKAKIVATEELAPQGIAWGEKPDWEERAMQLEVEEEEIAALAPSMETE